MTTPVFDHEKLKVYQEALRFVAWVDPILDRLPGKLSAKDQLDRASTSTVLNLAEGNGKRSHPDRCRYFDTARGSAVECAACLDVLRAKHRLTDVEVVDGKSILIEVVSMTAGLIARFSSSVHEDAAPYGEKPEIEEKDKE